MWRQQRPCEWLTGDDEHGDVITLPDDEKARFVDLIRQTGGRGCGGCMQDVDVVKVSDKWWPSRLPVPVRES